MHRVMLRVVAAFCGLFVVALVGGCKTSPTLDQQEQMVRANNLLIDQITTRAVVNAWGAPPHHHTEFANFFVMPDFSMIPRSRVPTGEVPKGWDAGVHAGEGVFFAYPARGWLLVFLDEHLVYKESLKPEELSAVVKAWSYQDRFKTRLDGTLQP